jgi:2-methylcitrate dehydratase PrpD
MGLGSMEQLLAVSAMPSSSMSDTARRLAAFSLFDWLVCTRAGEDQELSRIMRDFVREEGGKPVATVVGERTKYPARAAALANGTSSHALDYDDTHFAHIGHLSVGIYPAALAAAEEMNAAADETRDAFLVGAEAACRIGMALGRIHYQRGFHQTATAGAIGATVAAGRLYRLTAGQMRNALSLVATRASGLKSQFGTMGKPYNAGIAAANGVEAASLAKRGFVSCEDGVAGPQGFIATHSDRPDSDSAWADPPPRRWVFEDNKYKLHACCHGTHAMIEALRDAIDQRRFCAHELKSITVFTHPRWLTVCDIKEPRTGLEVKFSYAHLAAMVVSGIDTSSDKIYTAALAGDEDLRKLAGRVEVVGDETLGDLAARVIVGLEADTGGEVSHDLASRLSLDVLERGLRAKARGLLGAESADKLWASVSALERLSASELAGLINDHQLSVV